MGRGSPTRSAGSTLPAALLASCSTLSAPRPTEVGPAKRLGWWTRWRSPGGCPSGRRRRCFDGFEQSEVHQAVSVFSASQTSCRGRLPAGARSGERDLTRGHTSTQRLPSHAPRTVRLGWLSPSSGGEPAPPGARCVGRGDCPTVCHSRAHSCPLGPRGNCSIVGKAPLGSRVTQSRPGSQRSSSSRAIFPRGTGTAASWTRSPLLTSRTLVTGTARSLRASRRRWLGRSPPAIGAEGFSGPTPRGRQPVRRGRGGCPRRGPAGPAGVGRCPHRPPGGRAAKPVPERDLALRNGGGGIRTLEAPYDA